jgi:hypothetical protein
VLVEGLIRCGGVLDGCRDDDLEASHDDRPSVSMLNAPGWNSWMSARRSATRGPGVAREEHRRRPIPSPAAARDLSHPPTFLFFLLWGAGA